MISSTILDLPEHREEVRAACEEQGVFPLMMEHQPATYENPIEFSMRLVDDADVYIGVYAYRYGYIPLGETTSLTEMEYNRAVQRGIPLLIFIMHKDHRILADHKEEGEAAEKLKAFKQRVETASFAKFFRSPEDLRAHVIGGLSRIWEPVWKPEAYSFQSALTEIRRALLQASSRELLDCLYKVRFLNKQFQDDPDVHDGLILEAQIEEAIEKDRAQEPVMRQQRGKRVYQGMKTIAAHPLFAILVSVVAIITTLAAFTDSAQKLVNLFRKARVATTGTPARTGKPTGNPRIFSVDGHFWPTGKMGDIGDVGILSGPGLDRFTYTTNGLGPHEWDLKYVGGQLSPELAQFGGVMYLNPQNNFGSDARSGFDLRGYRVVKWEARSLTERVNVQFSMGGVTWVWDSKAGVKVAPPFPETLSVKSLGLRTLDTNWQQFDAPFAPEDDLTCVIDGFAWTINWPSNDVSLNANRTGPVNPRTFQFEVRDIRYER